MHLMISKPGVPNPGTPDIAAETISYGTSRCAMGEVLVARSSEGVCAILIGDTDDQLEADVVARFPNVIIRLDEGLVRDDLVKVVRFIDNPAHGLDLTLDMRGTPFQRRVWAKLRKIATGKTISYTQLAKSVSASTSARAVAGACAANPIALAIPCHRVVRSDGALAGYRWGIERKRQLLQKEAMA